MGKKMAHAPVYYVLAQVRFNAVLALEQYMSKIQESLRLAGFPDFERAVFTALNMNIGGAQGQAVPALQSQLRFQFLNSARTAGFNLETNGMVFQTTDYDTFGPFSEALLHGLSVVHDAAKLDYSERIGIRFLDAVWPNHGDTLPQYLTPSILGLFDKLNPRKLQHAFSETRTTLDKTTLVSRSIIYEQETEGVSFPPELQPMLLNISERFGKIKGLYAVIDTDCFLEDRQKFDLSNLATRLKSLHDEIGRSFELMVTQHAHKVWD